MQTSVSKTRVFFVVSFCFTETGSEISKWRACQQRERKRSWLHNEQRVWTLVCHSLFEFFCHRIHDMREMLSSLESLSGNNLLHMYFRFKRRRLGLQVKQKSSFMNRREEDTRVSLFKRQWEDESHFDPQRLFRTGNNQREKEEKKIHFNFSRLSFIIVDSLTTWD